MRGFVITANRRSTQFAITFFGVSAEAEAVIRLLYKDRQQLGEETIAVLKDIGRLPARRFVGNTAGKVLVDE